MNGHMERTIITVALIAASVFLIGFANNDIGYLFLLFLVMALMT